MWPMSVYALKVSTAQRPSHQSRHTCRFMLKDFQLCRPVPDSTSPSPWDFCFGIWEEAIVWKEESRTIDLFWVVLVSYLQQPHILGHRLQGYPPPSSAPNNGYQPRKRGTLGYCRSPEKYIPGRGHIYLFLRKCVNLILVSKLNKHKNISNAYKMKDWNLKGTF